MLGRGGCDEEEGCGLLHARTSSGVSMRSLSQLQRSRSGMCMYCTRTALL